MCCSIEELFEFKDKTDYRYSEAIIDECTGKEGKYSKLYKAAESLAITKNISVVEAMAELSSSVLSPQIEILSCGNEIWFNRFGGWNIGLGKADATIYMKNLIFPDCRKEDIRISKFSENEGGKHYYAKIGTIEVCDYIDGEKIIKWNTRDEAYSRALKYCEELNQVKVIQ